MLSTTSLATVPSMGVIVALAAAPQAGVEVHSPINVARPSAGYVKFDTRATGVAAMVRYAALRAKLDQWQMLPFDWDGGDGGAPASETIETSRKILDLLEVRGVSAPLPTIAGDGEVSFIWELAGGFASISVLDDGHVAGYVRKGDVVTCRVDELAELVDLDSLVKQVASAV